MPHLLFSGPAGVGKCVTGETPVLTSEGLSRMGTVAGDIEGFERADDGLEVLTLTDRGEFEYTSPSHRFGKTADEVVTVRTRDGGEMTVTPEHRLLVVTNEGLEWRNAEDLEEGDRVARPLEAPLPESDSQLDWFHEMDGERTFVHVTHEFAREHEIPYEAGHVGQKKKILRAIRREETVDDAVAAVDAPRKYVLAVNRQVSDDALDATSATCPLSAVRSLKVSGDELRRHIDAIQWVSPTNNNRSPSVTPPWEVTPELTRFVGLAISEARVSDGRIKFYNTDETLLDQFETAAQDLFAVEPKRGTQQGVPYVELNSRTLTEYLSSCFDVFAKAVDGEGDSPFGSTILRTDVDSRRAFLRAVFDAEGHVTESGIIELTQKDGGLITLLSYLLADFGIPSRRKQERKAPTNGSDVEREYHTLYVSGSTHLARFADEIGFTVEPKSTRLESNAARDGNPNHDTVPVQRAVDDLCDALHLPKSELCTASLNPDTPGRENYEDDLVAVLESATDRIERTQEVIEALSRLEADLTATDKVPVVWAETRPELEPIETRREVESETGIRKDRLLEYADGRRTPYAERAERLVGLVADEELPDTDRVQQTLRDAIDALDVTHEQVTDGTHMLGTDVSNLLNDDDIQLRSFPRFATVASRLETVATEMLSMDVLEDIRTLDRLVESSLYFDEVTGVEHEQDSRRVYDLTVPKSRNYVAGHVPTVMHNTTCASAIARELYGEDWEDNFLELNASDERGIDVVRDRIKSFARTSFGGVDHRIIFLDEADALTSDAQGALRRTMEQFSNNVRFILSCNYSSRIIDPIQSRCAVFRFSPLSDEAVAEEMRHIADAEGIELTEGGVDALVYAADGDMRKAINALQAASVTGEVVDEEAVYALTSTARPEAVHEMVEQALDGDFTAARSTLDRLLTEEGIAGGDVIDQLHRGVWEFDLDDEAAVRLLDRIGETEYRITRGASERVQLEAMLASLALED
ncbi:replication factor C small subunit [Halobacteriales archaeon QH_3_68_24]|nr:MAG: replication factor C small subunit [Halobacteriales archaeon QH_3_68_24]